MRTKMIAGNWKMNTTLADALVLAGGVRNAIEHIERIEVVLCPPTIWLTEIAHEIIPPNHLPHLKLGGQNLYFEPHGAFTGETAPGMIAEVAEYVIIGHSERTHIFGETPELITKKIIAALEVGLKPIVCIGEDERTDRSKTDLTHQLHAILKDFSESDVEKLVVAYEPVWAISGGNAAHQAADPEYANEVMGSLRTILPAKTRILYGGSANDENCRGFLMTDHCDGLLVGGASLKLKNFNIMCQVADDTAGEQGHKSRHS